MTLLSRSRHTLGVIWMLMTPWGLGAQVPAQTRCDSIVAASRVDSVPVSIYIRTARLDGALQVENAYFISQTIASAFIAPRPFRVSVFSGASQMRVLRRLSPDSAGGLRAPTLTGVYRYSATKQRLNGRTEVLRTSLVPGFDSAAIDAIRSATTLKEVRDRPDGDLDVIRLEVRFSTDSALGAVRLAVADFPRMPVIDAVPNRDNPAPEFPDSAKSYGLTTGEVVMRFVVDPSGEVTPATLEATRVTSLEFLRAALTALPMQRFSPATIRGCPIAQVVDYSFSFVLPTADGKPPDT